MSVDTSPRTYRYLPVEVMTPGHRVAGKMMVTSTGAVGILNDTTRSLLEIHDAGMAALGAVARPTDHFDIIRLVKARLSLIVFVRREDLGPQSLVRGGYTNVVEYPVRIATPAFEIDGLVEFPGRFDFTSLMTEGAREFVPVFNAAIAGVGRPDLRIQAGGILLNRRHIDIVSQLNQRTKRPPVAT